MGKVIGNIGYFVMDGRITEMNKLNKGGEKWRITLIIGDIKNFLLQG